MHGTEKLSSICLLSFPASLLFSHQYYLVSDSTKNLKWDPCSCMPICPSPKGKTLCTPEVIIMFMSIGTLRMLDDLCEGIWGEIWAAQHSDEKSEYCGATVLGPWQVAAEYSGSCRSGPPRRSCSLPSLSQQKLQ